MASAEENRIEHSCALPDDAVTLSVVEVVEYLDEEGYRCYAVRQSGTDAVSTSLGLLELAKRTLINESDFGDED